MDYLTSGSNFSVTRRCRVEIMLLSQSGYAGRLYRCDCVKWGYQLRTFILELKFRKLWSFFCVVWRGQKWSKLAKLPKCQVWHIADNFLVISCFLVRYEAGSHFWGKASAKVDSRTDLWPILCRIFLEGWGDGWRVLRTRSLQGK